MSKYILHNSHGFTLIELLLYLALSTLMVVVLGGIGVHVLSARSKVQAEAELNYNIQFSIEKMRMLIEEATAITSPDLHATSSTLSFTSAAASQNPVTIDLFNDQIRLQEGDAQPVFLTSNAVDITKLQFTNATEDASAGLIQIVMNSESHNPAKSTDRQASSSVTIAVASLLSP